MTVTPSSGDTGAVTVSGGPLTFTTSNWGDPQTVTVTPVDDGDADDETVTIANAVSGADYGSVAADDVTVNVDDDEIPAIALVSNTGPAGDSVSGALVTHDYAQGFRTGNNSAGYTAREIDIKINASTSTVPPTVKLVKTSPTGTGAVTLEPPASITAEVDHQIVTYAVPSGTTLDASSTYFLLIEAGPGVTSHAPGVRGLTADAETGEPGWSIDDGSKWRVAGASGSYSDNAYSLQIAIRGSANPVPNSPAATVAAGTSPVTEGTAASFTVMLSSAAPAGGITVNLTVADAAGSDFVAAADEGAKTLAFAAGETSNAYTVATVADSTDEADGDVTLTVGTGAGYTVGSPSSATVTVNDDDGAVSDVVPALVSNTGQTPTSSGVEVGEDQYLAQAFTTGTNASGYLLSEVQLHLRALGHRDWVFVQIFADDGSGAFGGSPLHTFVNPATISGTGSAFGANTFTAPPDAVLLPETTYHLAVTGGQGSRSFYVGTTTSDSEDAGGAAGWNIANYSDFHDINSPTERDASNKLRIAVRGSNAPANNPPTVANAIPDQGAQVGVPFSYTFPEDTFAHADGDALTYRASAGKLFEEGGYEVIPGTRGKRRPGGWLRFDASSRTISGTPPPGSVGRPTVRITAKDEANRDVSDSFRIAVAVEPGLVGNLAQPVTVHRRLDWCDHAQKFTTGSHGNGYAVTSVDVWLSTVFASTSFPTVAIRNVNSGGGHGSAVGTLAAPASRLTGSGKLYRYTASAPLALDANTTYVLTFEGGSASVWRTGWTGPGADAGSAAGWSLATTNQLRCHGGSYRDSGGRYPADGRSTSTTTLRINGTTGGTGSQQVVEAPTIEGLALGGVGGNGAWDAGDTLTVTLTFSEAVAVDTTNGTPTVAFDLGGTKPRAATYASGSGTTELVFEYAVVTADGSNSLASMSGNNVALNGGTIRSVANGTDADLAHQGTLVQASSVTTKGAGPEATFADPPGSHDGESGFTVRVRFSGAPTGLSAKRDAASVLEVEGGTVTGARAETKDAASPWLVTVAPDGDGDVTVRIPVRECTEANAVCIGGRPLVRAAEATVPGPDTLAGACGTPALAGGATLVWTGRLGIAKWPGNEFYGFGQGVRGTLDDTDFTLGSNGYAIDHVTQRDGAGGPLLFSLTGNLEADERRTLTLHACDGTALDFRDASGPSSRNTYRWNGTGGLDWSGETERTLHLSRDTVAPTLATATVDGASLALAFSEDLAAAPGLTPGAFAVTADAEPVTVDSVAVDAGTVTLALASPASAGAAVTVSYAQPPGAGDRLRDRFGNLVADIAATDVTNGTAATLPVVSIVPASTPVTEGTAAAFTLTRTGSTAAALEVSVSVGEAGSVIAGTPPASAAFAEGASETRLTVATENDATHEADARVTVSVVAGDGYTVAGASAAVDVFDDDPAPARETAETLWSTTMLWQDYGEGWYGGHAEALGRTVAAFDDPVWTEDGTTFRIWYISYHAPSRELEFMHDGTGGNIAGPDTLSLRIGRYTVEPGTAMAAFAEVRPATVSGIGSHWTAGEEIEIRLTRRTGETAETPAGPGVSVDDAQVNESSGEPLRFVVRLAEPAAGTVSVRYATSDGSARAGEDYAAARGALRFGTGQQSKTVEVAVLEDVHDEGSETMTLTLSRPFGATLGDARATGTISNTDPMPEAWLARFGRTVAEQAVDAVRSRLDADRTPGFRGRFAGQPLPDGTDGRDAPETEATEAADDPLAVPELTGEERRVFMALLALETGEDAPEDVTESRAVTDGDILLGTSFDLVREAGGLSLGFWGRAARSGFAGREGELALDGDVTSVMLGTDWTRRDALFGLMLFRSRGSGGYAGPSGAGRIAADLAGLVPWAGRDVGEGLSVWGAAGTGRGEMALTPEGQDPVPAGLGWSMAAAGAEGAPAVVAALGDANVRWRADALATETSSEAAAGLAAASARTSRLRVGLETAWSRTLASGATVHPRAELGLRRDGGDAGTGFGIEAGGGVRFEDPGRGLSVSVDGRALALHEDRDLRDWGVAVSLSWDPRPETRLGPSVIATRGWGGAPSGGVAALLEPETIPGGGGGTDGGPGSIGIEMAWGTDLSAWRHGTVGSAYGRVSGSPDAEDLRLGWRVAPDAGRGTGPDHDFWLERGPENAAVIGAGLNWSAERRRVRSSTGLDLRAGVDGAIETGIDMAWEW